MAVAFVQSKSGSGASVSSIVLSLGAAVTSGNLIGTVYSTEASSFTSVADNGSSTYTPVDTQTPQFAFAGTHYAKNVTGSPTSITFTFGSAAVSMAAMHEASGCDTTAPLDGHAYQEQNPPPTTTDGVSSTANATNADGDYIIGFAIDYLAGGVTYSAGTGFTPREVSSGSGSVPNFMSEDKIQTTHGSIAATFTDPIGQHCICFMLAFKAAGGGGLTTEYVAPMVGQTASAMIGRRYV